LPTPRDPLAEQRKREREEDGRKAMSEYEAEKIAIREKSARLRALRLAREAEQAAQPPARTARKTAATAAKSGAKAGARASATGKSATGKTAKSGAKSPEKLSDWLQEQQKQGRQR